MSSVVIESIVLGVVQGLTEFLPISSSGHLVAMKMVLGSPLIEDQTLDVFLHFATLLAVFLVFRGEFVRLFRGVFQGGADRRFVVAVTLGAIPAGVVGWLARDGIEGVGERYPFVVSAGWLFTALALWTLRKQKPDLDASAPATRLTPGVAVWVGLWQVLALLPGVSRSGSTIAAGVWGGLRRDEAASFSFLCGSPLILGATLLKVLDVVREPPAAGVPVVAFLVGGLVAFATGLLALRFLLRSLRTGSLHYWAYYLVPLAVAYEIWRRSLA